MIVSISQRIVATAINMLTAVLSQLIASAGQERKSDVVRILMRHFNVNPEQVMFVDDMQTTLDILNHDTGIIGVHLSHVKDLKTKYGDTLLEYMDD